MQAGTTACRTASPSDFVDRLNLDAPRLGSARLFLLDNQRTIVYDSAQAGTEGTQVSLTPSRRFAGVFEARTSLDDQNLLVAATKLPGKRVDPLGAAYVMIAQPEALVATAAAWSSPCCSSCWSAGR